MTRFIPWFIRKQNKKGKEVDSAQPITPIVFKNLEPINELADLFFLFLLREQQRI